MKRILGLAVIAAFSLGLAIAACDSGDSDKEKHPAEEPGGDITIGPGGDASGGGGTEADVVEPEPDIVCVPKCEAEGLECGDDGCGGSCGQCKPGFFCKDGKCEEAPNTACLGKECGPDGKGGYCGNGNPETQGCPEGYVCNLMTSKCEEVDWCAGKECGPDGHGGTCGVCPCEGCDPSFVECNFETGKCQAPVEYRCADIFDCLAECPPGDQACAQKCINDAPIDEQMKFQALVTCLEQAGYFNCQENDDKCLYETMKQCNEQFADCFAIGDGTCLDMYLCIIACPHEPKEEASECVSDCQQLGNKEAWLQWDAFIDCLDQNGYFECAEGDEDCLDAAWKSCGPQFQACAHGDWTCKDIVDCLETCAPTDQVCGVSCFLHGSIAAQEAYQALVDCIVTQCGENATPECENNALMGACSNLYNDCLGS